MLLPGAALCAEDAPRLARLSLLNPPGDSAASEEARARSERWRAPPPLRILVGVGGGTIMALSAGTLGALGGLGLCSQFDVDQECLGAPFVGAFAGALVGYPLGVWGSGEAVGGDGRLWATMLGAGVGFAAGLPIALNEHGAGVLPFVLTVLGAHLGYEMSQSEPPASLDLQRPRFQPLLSLSDHGGWVGLSGRF
jgi:hypothetical protein